MKICVFLFLLTPFVALTQGYVGSNAFAFVNTNYSASSTGLGGNLVAVQDNDLSMSAENPALLNLKSVGMIQINQSILPNGISIGMLNYAFNTKHGVFSPTIKYINYGNFEEYDETGNRLGTFTASDYSIGMGYGKTISKLIGIGTSVNFLGSNLETYSAYAMTLGFGAFIKHPNDLVSAAFSVKNIGFVFKDYTTSSKSILPIDVQAGVSGKLKHAPFRFSVLGHHLNKWNIVYQDPNLKPSYDALTGDTIPVKTASFISKLAHHLTFQIELLASKNLHFRLGFDYHRRQQLKLIDRPGLAGFSSGIAVNFKKFKLDYGFMYYSKAGQNHSIGLSTNLGDWKKKSKIEK